MNSIQKYNSLEELEKIISNTNFVLLYFNTTSCSVGEALEPKVKDLINNKFPKIDYLNVDINLFPEISAKYNAFVEPTILVYIEGKEYIRKSRNIGLFELEDAIKRLYQLIF